MTVHTGYQKYKQSTRCQKKNHSASESAMGTISGRARTRNLWVQRQRMMPLRHQGGTRCQQNKILTISIVQDSKLGLDSYVTVMSRSCRVPICHVLSCTNMYCTCTIVRYLVLVQDFLHSSQAQNIINTRQIHTQYKIVHRCPARTRGSFPNTEEMGNTNSLGRWGSSSYKIRECNEL
jgi:predicted adenine nucleotide alpha hydrolase (AANH) superfamily ATPase